MKCYLRPLSNPSPFDLDLTPTAKTPVSLLTVLKCGFSLALHQRPLSFSRDFFALGIEATCGGFFVPQTARITKLALVGTP